ncbi:hypothetical protein AMC99_01932 [Altererythrobacter epoxidivorans]|uniref:Uncharacterized protein n=1 Tax=Altererythrobacter epoxidivorans TaxID=361183 RepID=A0A0M4MUL7_9SPHN|nr:hypothetical protein AMC99_01932 [Altererythrobacter epoxidivorans]
MEHSLGKQIRPPRGDFFRSELAGRSVTSIVMPTALIPGRKVGNTTSRSVPAVG